MADPPHEQDRAYQQFRAARDQLLALRDDLPAARDRFGWPKPERFNWGLDWFDRVAADPATAACPALVVVEEDGSVGRLTYEEMAIRSSQVGGWLQSIGV